MNKCYIYITCYIFHNVRFMKTEHQRLAAQMENCKFCLDSAELAKHLIIAIGLKVSEYFTFLFIVGNLA